MQLIRFQIIIDEELLILVKLVYPKKCDGGIRRGITKLNSKKQKKNKKTHVWQKKASIMNEKKKQGMLSFCICTYRDFSKTSKSHVASNKTSMALFQNYKKAIED